MLKYCLDRYKTQDAIKMIFYDDDFLPTLNFVPDWFVTNKMIKKFYNALFPHDDILFSNKDSDNVTFSSDEMGINSVNRKNINLDDGTLYEDDHKNIILVRMLTWHSRLKQHEAFKKEISKELMPAAWHPTRLWDCCMPKDKKKEIELFLIDKK